MAVPFLFASSSSPATIARGTRVSAARLSQCLVFFPTSVRRLPPIAFKTPQLIQHIVPLYQERGRHFLLCSGRAKEQSYPGYMSPYMTSTKASMQTGSGASPYEVLTETEGKGSVPGGNNISVELFDPERLHKAPSKMEKPRVLLIGKGCIMMKIVEVAVKYGYAIAIFALVGDTTPSDPSQFSSIVQNYMDLGVVLIQGDLDNHESLVKAAKAADVVISVVGYAEIADQNKIIDAIKEAGNMKRFIIAAEFLNAACPGHAVDPAKLMYENLVLLKQNVERARIPYTFISYNIPAGPFLPYLGLGGIGTAGDPADHKVIITGDGNLKVVFVTEEDVATWTIKAIEDPGTRNKIFVYSGEYNELMPLYKKKV